MSEQIIIAFIGVGSALITGVIVQVFAKILDDKRKKKVQVEELITKYLFPLHSHVLECKRRLDTIYENLNNLTCDNRINRVNDIFNQQTSWYYEHGHYLASTCYAFSCLFAQLYRVKFKLPLLYLDNKKYEKLSDFTNKIVDCFRDKLGVYYILIFDIGKQLYMPQDDLLSFGDFCELTASTQAFSIYRLFNYFIDIGKGRRANNLEALTQIITDMDTYLETSIKKSVIAL